MELPATDVAQPPLVMFADAPHEEDPRQAKFASIAQDMRTKDPDVRVVPTVGFPASRVDLGWLVDHAEAYWADRPGMKLEAVAEQLVSELLRVVQRLKEWRVEPWRRQNGFDVRFHTKDDGGWYEYCFGVAAPDPKRSPECE